MIHHKNKIVCLISSSFLIIFFFISCSQKKKIILGKEKIILLLPGFTSNCDLFENAGIVDNLTKKGLKYGGNINKNSNLDSIAQFYSICYTDSVNDLNTNTLEVYEIIKKISHKYPKNELVLCGYSMGGLIARNFLIKYQNYPKILPVKSIIFVSTCHNGVLAANFAEFLDSTLPDKIREPILNYFPINSKAIPFFKTGDSTFTQILNQKQIPQTVCITNIISQANLSEFVPIEIQTLTNLMGISSKIDKELDSDGLVSISSQNLKNSVKIEDKHCYQNITFKAAHFNILSRFSDSLSKVIYEQIGK